jgi:uncharacterized protein (DUF2062 family)
VARKPRRTLLERGKRIFRYIYLRLIRVGGDPVHIALGFALGVFLGIFPTFGLGLPLSFFIASLTRWNRVSAMLGSLVMNPLTATFFWSISGTVGAALFRANAKHVLESAQNGERIKSLTEGALIYLAGNSVISLIGAVLSYFVALKIIRAYRGKKHERWARTHPSLDQE